jgi:hypothetical protein
LETKQSLIETMDSLRDKILNYRDRFKRLDRKWHLLIGSQLLFVLAAFRYRRQQNRLEQLQLQSQKDTESSIAPSSAKP